MGENPAQSEADVLHARHLLESLDLLVVQDLFLTQTAELADVVLPAAAAWCEAEGTVTNSERRVQRVRKAIEPPGEARDDLWILTEVARHLGREWPSRSPRTCGTSCVPLADARGMSYARLEELGGIQWPCPHEDRIEPSYLHGRLWAMILPTEASRAFSVVEHERPSTCSTTTSPSASRPDAASTATTPACRAARSRHRCARMARRSISPPPTRARSGWRRGSACA
jgi:formate dehydrogenase major subunit